MNDRTGLALGSEMATFEDSNAGLHIAGRENFGCVQFPAFAFDQRGQARSG